MKCRHLLVTLDKDYSEETKTLDSLKAFLNKIDGLFFVTRYDNAVRYLLDVDELDNISWKIGKGQYEFVSRTITETKEYIIILKPKSDSFKDLDEQRITGMFDAKED